MGKLTQHIMPGDLFVSHLGPCLVIDCSFSQERHHHYIITWLGKDGKITRTWPVKNERIGSACVVLDGDLT